MAALFASAGVIRVETVAQMFDVGTLLAHQPLPDGQAGGDRRQLHGHRRAGRRRRPRPGAGAGERGTGRHRRQRHARRTSAPPCRRPSTTTASTPSSRSSSRRSWPGRRSSGRRCGRSPRARPSRSSPASCPPRASRRSSPSSTSDGMPARGSVPSYSTPERAVIALAKVAEYARWRRRPVGEVPELPDVDEDAAARPRARGPRRRAGGPGPHRRRADRPARRLRRAAAGHPDGLRRRRRRRRGGRGRLPGGAQVHRALAAAPLGPGRCAARPRRRRRGADRVRRHPLRRPGDRPGDGRARGGDGGRDRRRPVLRRAGQLRPRAESPPTCSATGRSAPCR